MTIDNFLDDPALDALYKALTQISHASELMETTPAPAPVQPAEKDDRPSLAITAADVQLGLAPVDRERCIRESGGLLVERGCVEQPYVDAMIERDRLTSVYIGMGIAIPHGTNEAKDAVQKTGVVLQQYPAGVPWGDEKAQLVFGIAGKGEEHLEVLANICRILEDEAVLEKMKTTDDVDWVVGVLSGRA